MTAKGLARIPDAFDAVDVHWKCIKLCDIITAPIDQTIIELHLAIRKAPFKTVTHQASFDYDGVKEFQRRCGAASNDEDI